MKIQQLRRKARSLLARYVKESADLEVFRKFSCSDYFKGETAASVNRLTYERRRKYLDRKVRQCLLLTGGEA